ncbi:dihydrolipoyl dehydrogenase [Vagococcus lutrae]|uniref:Dihydrolipoyl dehydrogenase n=1 Tax=Vagococcus lutrae LBD1 TaxID=1408226 RepID=V6QD93_9ENTE|nr:dihydrolipoyl dehydrogenase [Vagococcus lutrae]EST90533.1 dihydrolipoyl dehydrogenase [Vagococcus lutrae LBD1]MCO7150936.1 dihydrolipoyl dehydrogenase [Vagococcus lutrae]MDT2805443.1 dihydrolipoyl dehydrogenase [Vagococcus lutrae]MDT2808065.1 dihydrolipoyl dehydrogenase [Vagococcus lutrae]MDT2812409.1 dihydrolipoyl dehydrogenase [Vagococcus lutrae]
MVVGDFAIELDTVVIGAGPGGYVAAIRAAQMGQKVAIIEREYIGGVCLNVGCIPSKALISAGHKYQEALDSEIFGVKTEKVSLDFEQTQNWKNNTVVNKLTSGVEFLLKKNKVEILNGEAFFIDGHNLRVIHGDEAQTYSFNNAIVATGSRPIEIKGFKFGGRIIDSTGGLNLTEVPKKLVIVGGGVIGAELGGAYANLGSEVTILEGSPQIIPNFEKDMVRLVEKSFKEKGMTVVTNAMAKGAVDNGDSVTVTYEADGKEQSIEADYVMVTVGRRPNTDELGLEVAGVEMNDRGLVMVDEQGRTNVESIFAIGDIVPGAALAHKASYEAKIAAEAIAGKPVAVDYIGMPAVAFTDPELATVGYTEKQAKEEGLDVKATKFPLGGNGRALSLNQTEGFVRLVTTKEDNVIIGAQVAGINASDIIAELGLAIEAGMNAEDIALTIHSHPSLAESVMDTAEMALGLPIHA